MEPSDKFYTSFSNSYAGYSTMKQPYLSAVNNFIKEETGHIKTMVDVGGGDGKRGKLISTLLHLDNFTLIDNSVGMIDLAKKIPGALVIQDDISSSAFSLENKYDIVLCLWNVLGHINVENRKIALKNLRSLVNDDGFIFLDVNNRYNAVHYGLMSILKNVCKDIFMPKKTNGDFKLTMQTNEGQEISTNVHLFNPYEMEVLFKKARLKVVKKVFIHYKKGEIKNNFWGGHLVYKLKKV